MLQPAAGSMRAVCLALLALLAAPCWAALDFNSGPINGTMGQRLYYFTPSGGIGPYVFAYVDPANPIPGMRVINEAQFPVGAPAGAKGALVGLPVAPGTYSAAIRLTDVGGGTSVDKTVTMNISVLNLIGSLPNNHGVGDTITGRFWGTGGTPPYTYSLAPGSGPLPAGLTPINPSTGETNGALTTAGSFGYTIRLTDSAPTPNTWDFGFSTTVRPIRLSNVPGRILPNGYINQNYSQTLLMTGGSGVYTFQLVSSDSLPAGLSLSSNGVLSGIPTQTAYAWNFSVVATDTTAPTPNTNTMRLTVSILPQTPNPLYITTTSLPDGGIGNHEDHAIYASGGLPPYTFSVDPSSSLPPETALAPCSYANIGNDPLCALLKRRQRTLGFYEFVVRVTDSAGNVATRKVNWNISRVMLYHKYLPVGGGPVPVLLQSFTQNLLPLGGTPPYTVTRVRYPLDMNIDNNGVISGTVLENGRNLRLQYTLRDSAGNSIYENGHFDVQSTGTPAALTLSGGNTMRYLQKGNGFSLNLTAGGSPLGSPGYSVNQVAGYCNLPPGLKLLKGNDFNNSATVTNVAQIAGTPNTAGDYACLLEVTDVASPQNRGRTNYLFHVSDLAFVTTGFAPAYVGQLYMQTVDVRGGSGSYTFSLSGTLPGDLTFNPATGTINGTPTAPTSLSLNVEVRSGSDMLSRGYTLNVYSLRIDNANVLPLATMGLSYSTTLTASGASGPFTWSLPSGTSLPSGLSLNANTGAVSGKPTTWGVFTFTVNAGNGAVTTAKTFTLHIKNLTALKYLQSLPTSPYVFVLGSSVNQILNPIGGLAPYTVTQIGGTMPSGLAIVPAESVSGTSNFGRQALAGIPTSAGVYTPRFRYQDSAGLTVERTVTIQVTPLNVATTNLQPAIVNQPYTAQLQGVGGSGTYTYTLANTVLNLMPPGLLISSGGLISGTPTSTGSYSFTLDMTDGVNTRRLTATVAINATFNRRIDLGFGTYVGDYAIGHGAAISLQPSGGGGTHTWTLLTPLPPGISFYSGASLPPYAQLSPPNALLAGAPTTPGNYPVKIRVDDSTGNFAIRDATFVVTALRSGPQNRQFDAGKTTLPARVNSPYSFSNTAVNGRTPVTFTLVGAGGAYLPPGLTMSGAGVLNGMPTEAGNFSATYLMTDADGKTVLGGGGVPIVYPAGQPIGVNGFSSPRLPSATTNAAYSFDLNQLILPGYGTAPFTWAFSGGTPPPGLSIVGSNLTGSSSGNSDYTFDLIVTDANGQQHVVYNAVILVCPGAVIPIPGSTLSPATLNVPYSQTFTAGGGVAPYTFRRAYNSSMPNGMNLSSAGVLSGTPTQVGKFLLQFEVTDATAGGWMPLRYILDVSGTPAAAITLAPTSISANYTIGSPNAPSPVPVAVGSTGTAFPFTASVSGGSWLSVSPASGTSGASVTVSFNQTGLGAGTYNGSLTVTSAGASNSPASIPVSLTVAPAAPCAYSISANSGSVPASGGPAGFNVVAAAHCSWTASTPDSWITIQPPGSGSGAGTVSFAAAEHASPNQRTGTVVVQGLTYTLTQFGLNCAITVSPSAANVPVGGGAGQSAMTASAAGCPWNGSTAEPWITLTNAAGTGSGSLQYTVAANTLPATRSGIITTTGGPVNVTQAGLNCTYNLSAPGAAVSSAGGPASVNMTAPAGCTWTTDTGPAWITLAAPLPSGNGNGIVNLSVAPNSSTSARSATVLIGGQSFQITQPGVPCNFTLSADTTNVGSSGGGGTVSINASAAGCAWTAASNANWLTLTPPANGSGSGSQAFTAAANGSQNARSATLTIAGQNLVINQGGLTCSFSLRSPSGSSPSGGGPTSIGVVTAPGCPWTAQSNAGHLQLTNGPSYSGPADVQFNVAVNSDFNPRTGTLTVANITYPVTQAGAPCTINLGSSSFAAGEAGAVSSFNYTTSVSSCPHVVESYTTWLTVTGASYAGTNGTVNFLVAPNTFSAPRSGVIKVGDVSFTVTQAASTCAYVLTSFAPAGPFGRLGGDGTVPMTFAPAYCLAPGVLVNGPPGMITLGPITSGPGTYTQNYTVGIYQSFINYTRSAEILVQGQIYKVKQNSW